MKSEVDLPVTGLRCGCTTGTCATAAATAAALALTGAHVPNVITVRLPHGGNAEMAILGCNVTAEGAEANVRKDAGDDPDITNGALVTARVSFSGKIGVHFHAGRGVGNVTLPGLQIPPGEPAINPVPRQMIAYHLLALSPGWNVEISIDNGEILAEKTFNPRLGIVGGLSILGSTGIVRPFSHESQLCSIRCSFGVADAAGIRQFILVPGHPGERAVRASYRVTDERQLIEVGNDWGFALDRVMELQPSALLVAGHPGKLVKFVSDCFDTHSSRSVSALPVVESLWQEIMGIKVRSAKTVEGFFKQLGPDGSSFARMLAEKIAGKVSERIGSCCPVAVALTDMSAGVYGASQGIDSWK